MLCCGSKNGPKKHTIGSDRINKLQRKFPRFAHSDLINYKQRFERMSKGNYITLQDFRDNMGLLGLESTSLIADRIYKVMAKSSDDRVGLEEYLEYMDILLHGTHDEKATQSFKLISKGQSEGITYGEFASWLISAWKMYNAVTGNEISANEEKIRSYFKKLDLQNDGIIDLEEYKLAVANHDYIFEWFNVFNKEIAENFNPPQIEKRANPLEEIEKEVGDILKLLSDVDNRFDDFERRGSMRLTWKVPAIILDYDDINGDLDCPEDNSSSEDAEVLERAPDKVKLARLKLQTLLNKIPSYKEFEMEQEEKPEWVKIVPKNAHQNQAIHWGDQEWNLILNIMLGIQKSVKAAAANFNELADIAEPEFSEKAKIDLIPGHPKNNPDHTIKFRDYAPQIFERIRGLYGIKAPDYIKSLGIERIVQCLVLSEFAALHGQCTSGKSGSFFYYTDDWNYMLKTLSKNEFKFLREILPNYYTHLFKNPHTLITRFYGVHKIVLSRKKSINFVVMGNVFNKPFSIDEIYDLKGSTYDRTSGDSGDKSIPLKDLDFMHREMKITIGREIRTYLMLQIDKDVKFLRDLDIIDYSLLVGIHYNEPEEREPLRNTKNVRFTEKDSGGMMSTDKSQLYFLGIIDILTHYGAKKKLERFYKGVVHNCKKISVAPPDFYSQRFLGFMENTIE